MYDFEQIIADHNAAVERLMPTMENFVAYKESLKSVIGYNHYTGEVDPNVSAILLREAEELQRRSQRYPSRVEEAERRFGRELAIIHYESAAYHHSLKTDVLTTAYNNGVAIAPGVEYMEFSPPAEALVVPRADAKRRLAAFFNQLNSLLISKYKRRVRDLAYDEEEFEGELRLPHVIARIDPAKIKDFQEWYEAALQREIISEGTWPTDYRRFYEFHNSFEPKVEIRVMDEELNKKHGIPTTGEIIELIGMTCL